MFKDPNCNYESPQHWNLDVKYLEPLKGFIQNNICNEETN